MEILGLELKRLNRSSYFLTIMTSAFVFVSVGLMLGAIFNTLIGPIDQTIPDSPHPLGYIPFLILYYVYLITCTVKRFHDMNMSGWLCLATFVPFVNLILGIMLTFVAGTDGVNKYGQPLKGVNVMGFGAKDKIAHQQYD